MNPRLFVLAILVLGALGCGTQNAQHEKATKAKDVEAALRGVDLSAVYRADKELQAAMARPISERERVAELDKLISTFKAELSIVSDRVSYDKRLTVLSPVVNKYSQIANAYAAYDELGLVIRQEIDCVIKASPYSDICAPRFKAQEDSARRKLNESGISCDPSHGFGKGTKCDFAALIAPMEAQATPSVPTSMRQNPRP